VEGQLLPNTEFGELELKGQTAETRAAGRLREEGLLSWKKWIKRVQRFLSHVELLLSPDLIIFGGGISEFSDQFLPQLETKARLVAAQLGNNAGIVGAAYAAAQASGSRQAN
jgi:polyphosphate glucokinase